MVYVVVTRYIPPVSADGGMQGWKRQPNFNDASGFGALAVSFMNSPSSPTPTDHRLQPRVTQDFGFCTSYQAVFFMDKGPKCHYKLRSLRVAVILAEELSLTGSEVPATKPLRVVSPMTNLFCEMAP